MRILRATSALLLCAVLAGCTADGPRRSTRAPASVRAGTPSAPTPAPELDFEGRPLSWTGSSPFTGAVSPSRDSRDLVLQITGLPTGGPFAACTGVRWTPLVAESPSTVTITLAGYAPRGGTGQCVDGLDATVPLPVTLTAPLDDRRLIDGSTGETHTVFDGTRMPTSSGAGLPDGSRVGPIRWDERNRVASRRWQSPGASPSSGRDVWISIGPAKGIEAGAPLPSRTAADARIGDAGGRVWHGGGPYDVVVVRFPRGADTVEVRTVQDRTRPDTVEQALRIARSLG